MCNIWKKPVEDELSLYEIEQIFSRYRRFSWVNLTGGEPFMRADFPDIVRIIDRNSPDLFLLNFSTNGYLTDTVVRGVQDILLHTSISRLMVSVSLDGPRDLHDRIRGLPGSWDKAIDTFRQLRTLRSRRFKVYLGYTLQKDNLDSFDETLAAVGQELGNLEGSEIHVNIAHVSGHYYGNDLFNGVPDANHVQRVFDRIGGAPSSRILDPVSFLEYRYRKLSQSYQKTGIVPLPCQAAAVSCFIDPYGDVYPCSIFAAPFGSLRANGYDLGALWRSVERLTVRRLVRDGSCPGCWTPCEAYQNILAGLLPKK
jgi:MoaA/NifB/PqqE/SkfB family radical SAM enzyme